MIQSFSFSKSILGSWGSSLSLQIWNETKFIWKRQIVNLLNRRKEEKWPYIFFYNLNSFETKFRLFMCTTVNGTYLGCGANCFSSDFFVFLGGFFVIRTESFRAI